MKIDKYYNFLELFDDCQEKAVFAIKHLTSCKFRNSKIRRIVTDIIFEGDNENYSIIEPYIDMILNKIKNGYDLHDFLNQYKNITDDELFKIESNDEYGVKLFKKEMMCLSIDDKTLEYLYYREMGIKEKANKEIELLQNRIKKLSGKLKYWKNVKTQTRMF